MRNTQWTGVIKMTFYEWSLRYGRRCQIFSIVTDILMFVFSEIKNNLIFSFFFYVLYVCNTHFSFLSFSLYILYVCNTHFFSFSLYVLYVCNTHFSFCLSLSMYFTYVTHIFLFFSFSLCTLRM